MNKAALDRYDTILLREKQHDSEGKINRLILGCLHKSKNGGQKNEKGVYVHLGAGNGC